MDLSNLLEVPADLSEADLDDADPLFGKSIQLFLLFCFHISELFCVCVSSFFLVVRGLNMGYPKLSSILWESRVVYWLWGESVDVVIGKLRDQ